MSRKLLALLAFVVLGTAASFAVVVGLLILYLIFRLRTMRQKRIRSLPKRPCPSARFAGTDGVSLETEKWVDILENKFGCRCYFFCGESDVGQGKSYVVDEAHFQHPDILEITQGIFDTNIRDGRVAERILVYEQLLKNELIKFIDSYGINMIIAENMVKIWQNMSAGKFFFANFENCLSC